MAIVTSAAAKISDVLLSFSIPENCIFRRERMPERIQLTNHDVVGQHHYGREAGGTDDNGDGSKQKHDKQAHLLPSLTETHAVYQRQWKHEYLIKS